ncbi:hypothetical protein CR513_13159, partial [Mucuna pruriens]
MKSSIETKHKNLLNFQKVENHRKNGYTRSNGMINIKLINKGYAQNECIDFNEIFSLIVRLTTIIVVLEICVALNLHLEQLDCSLHGELEE